MMKTILVTGASDGIGKETARQLAAQGHRVILHGRSEERVAAAADAIRASVSNAKLDVVVADFARLDSVRTMALEVTTRFPALNVLVNNAGVFPREHATTADGLEVNWGVNHVAPAVLTLGLLPLLQTNQPSRIVMVSSMMHVMISHPIDYDSLCRGKAGSSAQTLYAVSKLGNVMFGNELHRRLRGANKQQGAKNAGVTVTSLHPGVIQTKLLRAAGYSGDSVESGARTSVFLASSAEVEGVSGAYFSDCREEPCNPIAQSADSLQKMWAVTLAAGNVDAPDR